MIYPQELSKEFPLELRVDPGISQKRQWRAPHLENEYQGECPATAQVAILCLNYFIPGGEESEVNDFS